MHRKAVFSLCAACGQCIQAVLGFPHKLTRLKLNFSVQPLAHNFRAE
jgi:hypothetical protein